MKWTELGLTDRQVEVLGFAAQGLRAQEIGHELHLSPKTVKAHLVNVRRNLGARNTAHAVSIGYETGLLGTVQAALFDPAA